MKKKVFGRHLGRSRKAREALLRSLARALVLSGKITTTKAKASYLQEAIDGMVARAKDGTVAAHRQIMAEMANDRDTVEIFFEKVVPAFKNKTSGFTRIIQLNPRLGDKASLARIEWTEVVDMTPKAKPVKEAKKETK